MGNMIASKFSRPLRTFNVEYRAEQVLKREKPIPAPSYPSSEKQKKIADEINPDFMKNHLKKDSVLDERLKKVFVSSSIKHTSNEEDSSQKVMPKSRHTERDFDFGFWEPAASTEGKVLFRDVLQFMTDNMTDAEKHSKENIAVKYKLNPKDVGNILEYYRIFRVVIPNEGSLQGVRVESSKISGTIEDK